MDHDIVLVALIVFFGATAAKDGKFWPDWLRIARLVSAVVLGINYLMELL